MERRPSISVARRGFRPCFWAMVRAATTPETVETQLLESPDQFEAWREWHQPVLDFLPEQSTSYEFPAELHLWELGGLAMSRTSVSGARISRRRLGQRSKYPQKCPFSLRSDQNSCTSGRISTGSSCLWRATLPEYCISARCRLRVGNGYASWTSSWRLHVGSRAPPASRDRERLSPIDKRCWRDDRGCGRSIGGAYSRRQIVSRFRSQ